MIDVKFLEQENNKILLIERAEQNKLKVQVEKYSKALSGINPIFKIQFGDFIVKCLYPINTRRVKVGNIATGRNFSWKAYSQAHKIKSDALFNLFSEDFVNSVERPSKKKIIQDFFQFRNAAINSFATPEFAPQIEYRLNAPVTSITLQTVELYDTVSPVLHRGFDNFHKRYTFIQKREIFQGVSAFVIFEKMFAETDGGSNRWAEQSPFTPRFLIALVDRTTKTLLSVLEYNYGNTEIPLKTVLKMAISARSLKSSPEFNYYRTSGADENGPVTKGILVRALKIDNNQLNWNDDFIRSLSSFCNIEIKNVYGGIITNFSEILVQPEIQSAIDKYFQKFYLITKALNCLKTKYFKYFLAAGDF